MAENAVSQALQTWRGWLVAWRTLVVRGLMLLVIWGLALFGYSSLGEQALQQRLPPVRAAMARHAQEMADYLQGRLNLLQTLADDPRLPQGLSSPEGTESLEVRRALYEFGYLNRLTHVYLWDETSGLIAQLASSSPLPVDVIGRLGKLGDKPGAIFLGGDENPPMLYAARHLNAEGGAHAYVLMPLGAAQFVVEMPQLKGLKGLANGVSSLVADTGRRVWQLQRNSRSPLVPADWLSSSSLNSIDVLHGQNGLVVVAPLPGYAGWAVTLPLSPAMAFGTSRYAQQGVLALAALLSLVVLWKPTRPIRRKVAAKMEPVIGLIRPLTAPMLASMAAVVKGKSQPAQPVRVNLQERPTYTPSPPTKRGRMMNMGSTAPRTPRPAATPFVPALKASLKAEGKDVPNKPMPAPPQDALAQLVDECLREERTQLLYQPIYNARTGMPVMHEVLLRLIDRDGQPMTPALFIPVCQQYGWMERMDAHVAKRVFEINFAGGARPFTPLAVNLSGDSMDGISYMETLMNQADKEVVKHLVFEVRSQELMQDPKALEFLRASSEMGVKLSVDYFGGGAAMVETSKRLGFDYIKMDCSRFGGDMIARKELIMLCRAASKVDLPVILEKMETVEMEVYARRIGVHYLQGYLLGKPKPQLVEGPLPGWRDMAKADLEAEEQAVKAEMPDPDADGSPPADQG